MQKLHCNKCKRDIVLNDIILNPLIIIQKEYLNYENIDSIFIDKEPSWDIQECPECIKINMELLLRAVRQTNGWIH